MAQVINKRALGSSDRKLVSIQDRYPKADKSKLKDVQDRYPKVEKSKLKDIQYVSKAKTSKKK